VRRRQFDPVLIANRDPDVLADDGADGTAGDLGAD
jgi:hypothetical protein